MFGTLMILTLAALLEIGGDAAIRHGLVRATWMWMAIGCLSLVAYGFTVNANRTVDFGRLLGSYIAVLFVVSQVAGWAIFGERPSVSLLSGGALIVAGGLLIQLGSR
jgi:drug/metabolite transporter superfamily protein YnfA